MSTLDFFLEQDYIQQNINEYIARQAKAWRKMFEEQLGDNIQK